MSSTQFYVIYFLSKLLLENKRQINFDDNNDDNNTQSTSYRHSDDDIDRKHNLQSQKYI